MLRPIYPHERAPVSIEKEAVWALELFWMFWRRKKLHGPDETGNLDLPVHSLIILWTMLFQLQIKLLSY
jgi:hypothetical protein